MATPYLTGAQASFRLEDRYGIENVWIGDALVELTSDMLDNSGTWVGVKQVASQERAFPRSTKIASTPAGEVPDLVLDWVALKAYEMTEGPQEAISSENVGGVSRSYFKATPTLAQHYLKIVEQGLRAYRTRVAWIV